MKNAFTLAGTLLFVVSTSIGCITGKDRPRDGGTLEDLPVGPTWPLATRAANRRFILGTGFDNAMKSTLAFGAIAVCKNFDGAGQAAIAIAIPNAPDTFNSQTVGAAGQVFVLVGPVYGTPAPSAPQDRPLGDGIDHALRVYGGTPSDHIGDALACGDLDGDGAEDLLIGAPEAADGRGEVYVFFGRNRATDKDISLAKDRAKVDIILQGARIGDHLGASVAVLRGVVADAPERGTIVMGSPGFDGLAGAAMDRGAVFLHLIPTPRLTPGQTVLVNPDKLKEQRLAAILGDHDGEGLGTTLATGRLSTNA
ncbi:MAG: FG-GAP repeat protein, partial [Deltaproteobacteria bacterium]|nr:FG-GAP repeat protein [Deltaproteobacteria bacterium]